jgi:hypothetical protein
MLDSKIVTNFDRFVNWVNDGGDYFNLTSE